MGLFATTKCKTWIYAEDDQRVPLVEADSGLRICALPSFEWILQDEKHKRYPHEKAFEQAAWDEIVIIHTSGTTGKYNDASEDHYLLG